MKKRMGVILFVLASVIPAIANAQVGDEIISKRTWNSKSFLNNDNTITVEISSGYVHYRDRDGSFQEIDRRIVLAPDSSHYQVTRGLYHAAFGFDLTRDDYPIAFELKDGTQLRAKLTRLAYYNRASKQLVTLMEIQEAKGIPNGHKIRYPDAFSGIDVEYEYIDTKLKQYAYLSPKARENLPDPQTLGLNPNNTDLVLVTQIAVPDSLDAFANNTPISTKPQGKIRLNFEGEDRVEFRNNAGKLKFFLPSDFAFASASVDSAAPELSGRKMWRRFFSIGDVNFMATGVPIRWLNQQPEGTIILDPTVVLSAATNDGYIYSAQPNTSYGSDVYLYVGNQSGVQRTLIMFSLSAIPENAIITSSELKLYFLGTTYVPVSRTIQCHEVLQSWAEYYASWHYRGPGYTWNVDGVGLDNVDAKSTPEGSQTWYNDYNAWKTYNLQALTQRWVDGTSVNYGVLLWATNETSGSPEAKRICSAEYTTDVTRRPKLLVTFQVNPLIEVSVYDEFSRPKIITYANGVTETNQYDDNRGWLTRRDYKRPNGSNIYYFKSDVAGDYDQAGNLKKVEYKYLTTGSPSTMEYLYNELHQIQQFKQNGNVKQDYDYDPNGNLITFTGKTMSYGNNNNQLTSDGSRTFEYDLAGRIKKISTTEITHDVRNNMTAYGSNTYAYDAFNQRIRKTEGTISKYYITSGPQVLAEYVYNSQTQAKYLEAEYIYALGRMVAKFDTSRGYKWFYVDHLGSTRMIDDGGTTALRRDYYPYGLPYLSSGNDQTAYQFTGKELDNVTGLYYFGARYYDPSIGRWFVPDPAGQDWSPYAYAGNRPVIAVDKDGRFWFIFAGAVIGAYFGGTLANDWHVDPGSWRWDKGKTYLGLIAGGVIGGYGGAGLEYSFSHGTGLGLSLQGIPIGEIGGASAGGGGAYLGYEALTDNGSGSGSGGRASRFGSDFTTEVHLGLFGLDRVYSYEGVPISIYGFVYDDLYFEREFLPDASLFRDEYGTIINVNAEYWIYKTGGGNVPWWGDPVDLFAGYGTAKAFGYSARLLDYPRAKGLGFNIYRNGERVLGMDWHFIGKKGNQWFLPHLDSEVHGFAHWPWSKFAKNFVKGK